ncbi:MAG: hypothetical protein IJ409_08595 [Lachnospiraceae bacterium]|nr:hypothetical protein [Lachnospiraceae bacterium]
MRRILETSVILLGTLGWWGFVYPELSLLETSYEVEYDESAEGEFFCFGENLQEAAGRSEELQLREEAKANEGAENPKSFDIIIDMPVNEPGDGRTNRKVRIKSKIAEYVYQVRNTGSGKGSAR